MKPKSEKSRFERKNMNSKQLRNVEWSMLICTIILVAIGLFALFSASKATELEDFKKQIMWIAISIPILLFMMLVDYKILARFSVFFYAISIILLILVLLTERINGARSWFNIGGFSLQPGEIAKIAVILFVSNVISKMRIQSRQKNK